MTPSTERTFMLAWLWSAAAVTVLRFLTAAGVGHDVTMQIQAAQNLLTGKGLSVYRHVGLDLADPATPLTLTHFPAGYSIVAAALLAMGASVAMLTKLMGAVGTMLGWWGWAKLSYPFFADGLHRGGLWYLAGLAIAILTPLRITPEWGGTDIFLWAAVPWVVHWVMRASDEMVPGGRWLDGVVGAVCGLCVLMRYASLFVAVYIAGVMLWQSRLRLATLTRRWAFFGLGLLPALALQIYINYFLSEVPATPGGVGDVERTLGFVVRRAWEGFLLLGSANYSWAFWLPRWALDLFTQGDHWLPWRLGIVLALVGLLGRWVATYDRGPSAAAGDVRIVASGLFVVIPLCLWGAMTVGSHVFVADLRYYLPTVPLSVLAVYSLVSLVHTSRRSRFLGTLHTTGMMYLAAYIAIALAGTALAFVPGEAGAGQRARLMGSAVNRGDWPSMKATYEFSPARAFVTGLLNEQPDTLLWTSRPGLFYADPAIDKARFRALGCDTLSATHLTGPARIVILTIDRGGPPDEILSWQFQQPPRRQRCYERLPHPDLIHRFPEERLKALEIRVPAGMRVVLKPRDAADD